MLSVERFVFPIVGAYIFIVRFHSDCARSEITALEAIKFLIIVGFFFEKPTDHIKVYKYIYLRQLL